jgi:hypothetical protein
MVRKRGEPNQHSFVLERRDPVTDGLGRFGRNSGPNRHANLVQGAAGRLRDASNIHQRVSERCCLSPQNCDPQISVFSCGAIFKNFHFKTIRQTAKPSVIHAPGALGKSRKEGDPPSTATPVRRDSKGPI